MFAKILVANRGEIARRVLRTCRAMGIATVAVYSDVDAGEPHVREADEAVAVGGAAAATSYLDVDAIVAAARRTGADAIHPGYGFLAENPVLAEACAAAGVTFVGPRADTIRLMADKAAAKRHLEEAGVPVVPGVHDPDLDDEALRVAADRTGYPVLLKAVAGGGGKGMRVVRGPEGLDDAVAAARREAAGAFGDDRLLVERLIDQPRHVEVQVLGDGHGHVVHVLERECSVQRRHQKVVEETPSPVVDAGLRERLGAAAVRAAAAVDYLGAGTVEFLVDGRTRDFHFLEMNTRLQVEHPVTEAVTGLDLVAWQLRLAAGEPLDLRQEDVVADGHALEVRLYAEDPVVGSLPQTGTVHRFVVPTGAGIRVDAGVDDGSVVSRHYDPLLAKLIVHGVDRGAVIERMAWVLRHTAVLGLRTNLDLLAAVVSHPAFARGDLTTGFLDDHLADWRPGPAPRRLVVAAAVALHRHHGRTGGSATGHRDPWVALGPWRTGQVGGWRVTLDDRDDRHELQVTGRGGEYRITLLDHDDDAHVRVLGADDGAAGPLLHLEVDGREVPAVTHTDGEVVWVHVDGSTRRLDVVAPARHVDVAAVAGHATFTAPMPGAVIAVGVAEGDHVVAGHTLAVVEAMKMEHPVTAAVAGTVAAVQVAVGDAVDAGAPLIEFDPD